MSCKDTTSPAFFEAKYRADDDPWRFAESGYELDRYRAIIRALGGTRFRHAWEPGCSVGVLTEQLAAVCDRVDACDLSPTAVERARIRCARLPGVTIRCASLTEPAPIQDCDLIVLSEIGYYFTSLAWSAMLCSIVNAMQAGATLLAAHWLGNSPDHILHGDKVHALMHNEQLEHQVGERHEDAKHGGFRLDRWRRRA